MKKLFFFILFLASSCVYADETYINGREASITEIQEFRGLSSDPSVAPVNKARIFYQASSDTLRFSVNGGAYNEFLESESDPIGKQTIISFSIDGCGQTISPGNLVWHEKVVPRNMTLTQWSLDGDVSDGNLTVDVQVSTAAPYTSYSSIVASAPPNVAGNCSNTSTTLTGWTTNLTEGNRLRLVPSAGATHKKAVLVLYGDGT